MIALENGESAPTRMQEDTDGNVILQSFFVAKSFLVVNAWLLRDRNFMCVKAWNLKRTSSPR